MTIKEVKEYYFKNLKIALKPKINVSDDYEVTERDLTSGSIFQKFVSGGVLTKTINGFALINDKVYYVYTKIDSIEISSDDLFPPCGGEIEITVNAVYSIKGLDMYGNNVLIGNNESYTCPVNAIIKIDNNSFTYNKPLLINKEPNNTSNNIVVTIYASYYHNGVKYEAYKNVTQEINKISPWLIENETTQYISLSLNKDEIPNQGGVITAKVERHFSRTYYMEDSCGNKVGGKNEPGLIEDITDKCSLNSSNKNQFSINKNLIKIGKQDIGAPIRKATITARYLDYTDSAVITQKEGSKITYDYSLSFPNGNKIEFLDLGTSLPIEKKIYITSKRSNYIDNKCISTINTNSLTVECDANWVYGISGEDEGGVFVKVASTDSNLSKNNDRECTFKITCLSDNTKYIKLIVSQPSLNAIKEEYKCEFVKDGEYTHDELYNANLYFHPYKLITYENGIIEKEELNEYITPRLVSKSSNSGLINISSINKVNKNYHIKFDNLNFNSINDIVLTAKLIFYDAYGSQLFESVTGSILVKKNNINNTQTITQDESIEKTSLKSSYNTKEKILKANLKVIVYSDNIKNDMWTNNDGYLLIDGKEKIKLSPCWLSPFMKDNTDIVYNGIIELEEGVHTFETLNVIRLDSEVKVNAYDKIKVDDGIKNITIKIEI